METGRKSERQHRFDVVEICRRMYERGYIAGTDGNVSVRLGASRILATPSGAPKGAMEPDALVVTDLDGRLVAGTGRPSSELRVHLAAYRARPDVHAVVHAHPQAAVAHTIAGLSLGETVIPETVFTLGRIADAEYETPGTDDLAERMAATLRCHDAILMERHGSVTLGADVFEAYYRLESLEHTARILYMARTLGHVEPLPQGEVERLYGLAEKAGIRWRFREDGSCPMAGRCGSGGSGGPSEEELAEVVARVLERLGSKP